MHVLLMPEQSSSLFLVKFPTKQGAGNQDVYVVLPSAREKS